MCDEEKSQHRKERAERKAEMAKSVLSLGTQDALKRSVKRILIAFVLLALYAVYQHYLETGSYDVFGIYQLLGY
jgi:uncharacterized membrane protein (DUF373 family)